MDITPSALPKHRTGRFTELLGSVSTIHLLGLGLVIYAAVPLSVSVFEYLVSGWVRCTLTPCTSPGFWDLIHFNFVTILTVGYGDYAPVGWGRVLSTLEAVWGVVAFGFVVAVATIKATLPPRNWIIFSKYGYYSRRDRRFMVVFVNTTSTLLVNPEMCAYYRRGTNWTLRPAYRAPFIRGSVWTFLVGDEVDLDTLVDAFDESDSLRFGITGQLGLSMASAIAEYEADSIIVIPDRDELTLFAGFRNANFTDPALGAMFHYRPQGSSTLREVVLAR